MDRKIAELKSRQIYEELFDLPEFMHAKTITFYAAKKKHNEVETEQMIRDSLVLGRRVVVPITDRKNSVLIFSEISCYDDLVPKTFDIPEPTVENMRRVEPYDTDLVIVPGIVFDECGFRLGYGKGYYDKFLVRIVDRTPRIPKIGLAYEFQIAYFPREQYDIPVDKIITEKRIIDCAKTRCA